MPTLDLQADLMLSAGGVQARIVADGDRLTLVTSDVTGLWDEFMHAELPPLGSSLPRLLGRVAGVLDGAGLTLDVTGADGTVLALGRGCHSLLGRVLAGDRHLRLGSRRAVVPAAAHIARTSATQHRRALLTVPAGVACALVLREIVQRFR